MVHRSADPQQFSDVRPRLSFIDGLRGLTALFVVLHHAWFEVFWTGGADRWHPLLLRCTKWLSLGQHGVNIFIVLSGFCLAMPLVKRRGDGFDIAEFFRRRARRILPPYYAAMAISLLLIAMIPLLQDRTQDRWDHALPAWTPQVLLSHLLLLHNWSPTTNWAINPPFWSIATEWQIYFVYALLLVPICRRLGVLAMTLAGLTLGCLAHVAKPELDFASFWFVGSFSLGAAAAWVAFSNESAIATFRRHMPWRTLSVIGCLLYLLTIVFFIDHLSQTRVETDLLVALVIALVLVDFSNPAQKPLGLQRAVQSSAAVQLGDFSYSLYLLHFPLLAIAHLWLRQMQVEPTQRLILMLFVACPAAVLVCWAFHLRFEKPFIAQRSKQLPEVARLQPALS